MRIASLDHLVLTVADIDATLAFYERLGMHGETFGTTCPTHLPNVAGR